VRCPVMEFGPDGAFGVDLRKEVAAAAFLKANGLEGGKFLCCLSRLRHTPYWKVKKGTAFDEKKHARNEAMKEHDHAPLREGYYRRGARDAIESATLPGRRHADGGRPENAL